MSDNIEETIKNIEKCFKTFKGEDTNIKITGSTTDIIGIRKELKALIKTENRALWEKMKGSCNRRVLHNSCLTAFKEENKEPEYGECKYEDCLLIEEKGQGIRDIAHDERKKCPTCGNWMLDYRASCPGKSGYMECPVCNRKETESGIELVKGSVVDRKKMQEDGKI